MSESIFRSSKEDIDDLIISLHKLAENRSELKELAKIQGETSQFSGDPDWKRATKRW
jgi:hypothetical protein